jgi:hypothetical protein
MLNKPISDACWWNKSLCLAAALGVTKFIHSHFVVLLKSVLDVE